MSSRPVAPSGSELGVVDARMSDLPKLAWWSMREGVRHPISLVSFGLLLLLSLLLVLELSTFPDGVQHRRGVHSLPLLAVLCWQR